MTVSPLLAAQIQNMGARETNQKLALAMSVLSVALVGVMVFKEMSHCMQERMREHEREFERRPRHDRER